VELLVGIVGVAGVLVGVAGTIIAYRSLKAQHKETNKKLHYVTYVNSLIVPRGRIAQKIELYFRGEELINPCIALIYIQNSGEASVVEQDFRSPIKIRFEQALIFMGMTRGNRPDVLTSEQLSATPTHIEIGPTLLNPGDAITFICLIEAASPEISVFGRLVGVDQISRLDEFESGSNLRFVRDDLLLSTFKTNGNLRQKRAYRKKLEITRFEWPLLANPNGQIDELLEQIRVRVSGVFLKDPHLYLFDITNSGTEPILPSDYDGSLVVRTDEGTIVHAELDYRIGPDRQEMVVRSTEREVLIEPRRLDPEHVFSLLVLVDGNGQDLRLENEPAPVEPGILMKPDNPCLRVAIEYDDSLKYKIYRFLENSPFYSLRNKAFESWFEQDQDRKR
jgi:hypothetical protein